MPEPAAVVHFHFHHPHTILVILTLPTTRSSCLSLFLSILTIRQGEALFFCLYLSLLIHPSTLLLLIFWSTSPSFVSPQTPQTHHSSTQAFEYDPFDARTQFLSIHSTGTPTPLLLTLSRPTSLASTEPRRCILAPPSSLPSPFAKPL